MMKTHINRFNLVFNDGDFPAIVVEPAGEYFEKVVQLLMVVLLGGAADGGAADGDRVRLL